MEMVINAVMLLHLECANPIDSPRHGGCWADGDRRRAPGPPAPSLPSPASLGPRAGRRETTGAGPCCRESGAAERLSGLPGLRSPPARPVRRARLSPVPARASHPRSPPLYVAPAPAEPRGSGVRPGQRHPGEAELSSGEQLAGGADGGPLEANPRAQGPRGLVFSFLPAPDPVSWLSFSGVPQAWIPFEWLLFPTQEWKSLG